MPGKGQSGPASIPCRAIQPSWPRQRNHPRLATSASGAAGHQVGGVPNLASPGTSAGGSCSCRAPAEKAAENNTESVTLPFGLVQGSVEIRVAESPPRPHPWLNPASRATPPERSGNARYSATGAVADDSTSGWCPTPETFTMTASPARDEHSPVGELSPNGQRTAPKPPAAREVRQVQVRIPGRRLRPKLTHFRECSNLPRFGTRSSQRA